jgi:hypothetical protein
LLTSLIYFYCYYYCFYHIVVVIITASTVVCRTKPYRVLSQGFLWLMSLLPYRLLRDLRFSQRNWWFKRLGTLRRTGSHVSANTM